MNVTHILYTDVSAMHMMDTWWIPANSTIFTQCITNRHITFLTFKECFLRFPIGEFMQLFVPLHWNCILGIFFTYFFKFWPFRMIIGNSYEQRSSPRFPNLLHCTHQPFFPFCCEFITWLIELERMFHFVYYFSCKIIKIEKNVFRWLKVYF